jgi:hypothetical protein
MKCPHCRFENLHRSLVCTSCGSVLRATANAGATSTEQISGDLLSGSEEALKAKAEWLAKRIQAKRALAARISPATINSPRRHASAIPRIESEMSLILGGVFLGAIALSFTTVYFSMPEQEASAVRDRFTDLVREAKREAVKEANADAAIGTTMQASASAQMMAMQPVAPTPAATNQTTAETAIPAHEPRGSSAASLFEAGPSKFVAAAKPRHRGDIYRQGTPKLAAGCTSGHPQKRARQYVVSFRRFWGGVLEERIYPNRRMSRRAQTLWDREGKILEADGTINEKYAIRRKTFTPIPGYPVS